MWAAHSVRTAVTSQRGEVRGWVAQVQHQRSELALVLYYTPGLGLARLQMMRNDGDG